MGAAQEEVSVLRGDMGPLDTVVLPSSWIRFREAPGKSSASGDTCLRLAEVPWPGGREGWMPVATLRAPSNPATLLLQLKSVGRSVAVLVGVDDVHILEPPHCTEKSLLLLPEAGRPFSADWGPVSIGLAAVLSCESVGSRATWPSAVRYV